MLREAIESVLSQTFRDFELIVVDDGSTDGTGLLAEEYRNRIRYIRRSNGGVSAARNTGIAASDAPFIAFLDSDDTWLPRKLEAQAGYIRENPHIDMHQTGDIWIRRGRRVNPGARHAKLSGRIFIPSLELCLISPSAVVLRRELLERHGAFDEDLPACEDYDLWLRLTLHCESGLVPERLVVRRGGHADQLSSRFWGMDRFRVYSIMKLLGREGGSMDPRDRLAAERSAREKCGVLLHGARRRGNHGLVAAVESVIARLEDRPGSSTGYRNLLEA